jgi:hypothetical protein
MKCFGYLFCGWYKHINVEFSRIIHVIIEHNNDIHAATLSSGRSVKLNSQFHPEPRLKINGVLLHSLVELMPHGLVPQRTDNFRSLIRFSRSSCSVHCRLVVSCPTVQFSERFWLSYFALYRSFGPVSYIETGAVFPSKCCRTPLQNMEQIAITKLCLAVLLQNREVCNYCVMLQLQVDIGWYIYILNSSCETYHDWIIYRVNHLTLSPRITTLLLSGKSSDKIVVVAKGTHGARNGLCVSCVLSR